MKKLFALLLALFAMTANAQQRPVIDYQTTVAAGGAITSPVFDLTKVGRIQVNLANASAAVARVLVFKCLAADGTTALFTAADQSVELSTQEAAVYDPHLSPVATPAKTVAYPILPCAKGQFTVAAAGADGATLQVVALPAPPLKVKYETSVAAGAVVNSPVIDTSQVSDISILVDNSAGAGARSLTWKCLANNGTDVLFTSPAVSVSNVAPGNAIVLLSGTASAATAATLQTIYSFPPCKKMSFHIAAAGAAAVGLAVYGR